MLQSKSLKSGEVQLTSFFLMDHAFGVESKSSLPNLRSHRFSPVLSSRWFVISSFIVSYMVHLSSFLWMVQDLCWDSLFFFFAWGCPILALFIEKMISSPLNCLCSFVKNQLTMLVWVCVKTLYSVPLVYSSILSPVSACLAYYSSRVGLEGTWCQVFS